MKLLKLENNNLCSITPEALGLQSFKILWDRDKSKLKEKARLDLSFVYFFADWASPFKKLPKEDRIVELEKEVYGNEYKADDKVLKAAELYETIQNESSFSLKFLSAAEEAASRTSEYLKTINLAERTKLGAQVYNVAQIQKAISDMPDTIRKISEMRKVVEEELSQEQNIRGGANKNPFED